MRVVCLHSVLLFVPGEDFFDFKLSQSDGMDQLGFLHLNQRNVPKVAKVSVTLRRQQQKRFAVVVIQRRVVQCGPRVFANVFPMSLEQRNRKCHY